MRQVRIGINGLGRIGRDFLRIAQSRPEELAVVAVNDLTDAATLAHLLQYDSNYGRFPGTVGSYRRVQPEYIEIDDDQTIQAYAERDPADIPWEDRHVDVVIESTGRFTSRESAAKHLEAGAKRVLLSAPSSDHDMPTFVVGVNDQELRSDQLVVSNASCTTNCLAPVATVMQAEIGIKHGSMTTIHAYTSDQSLQDGPHSDLRRARAAAVNLIPTSTGAAKAIGLVLPDLQGKLDGFAVRAPVPIGSLVDLTFEAERETAVVEVNAVLEHAANHDPQLRGILEYSEAPLVSSDIHGPHSSVVDAKLTSVTDRTLVKVVAWYDNEWGYALRLVEMAEKLGAVIAPAITD